VPHRYRQEFDLIASEYPALFDAVWESATRLEDWPKCPDPALRLACELVACGTPSDVAVSTSFRAARRQ
jgi:hypothetical protein